MLHTYPIDIDATISSLVFWNQIVEIKKGKQNLNWRNTRMHQFLGSEMMKMERCRDAKMEKIIWSSSMEIQRCRIGLKNEFQWRDEEMQKWREEFEHLQWKLWNVEIEFINELQWRDVKMQKSKLIWTISQLKEMDTKTREDMVCLLVGMKKKLKGIKKQKRQDIL